MKKRILSMLLVLCMVGSLMPTVAIATDAAPANEVTKSADFTSPESAEAAIALLNTAKTPDADDSTFTGNDTEGYTLTLNGID